MQFSMKFVTFFLSNAIWFDSNMIADGMDIE